MLINRSPLRFKIKVEHEARVLVRLGRQHQHFSPLIRGVILCKLYAMTMSSPEYPPLPPFHSLRLAVASDIERIADISVIGFKDSEIFRYERPRYADFPEDAVASFANIYRTQLLDPLAVVIVAQDSPNSTNGDADCSGTSRQRIVVGVASWRLAEKSPRQGQFVVPDVGEPRPAPDRDLCQHRLDLFRRITQETENQ